MPLYSWKTIHRHVSLVNYKSALYLSGKGDWVKDCVTKRLDRNFVRCNCNHLSFFGVLVVSVHDLCVFLNYTNPSNRIMMICFLMLL